MASSPITSCQIEGGKVETVGSKITADGDYSHEIKRCLLLGRQVMTNLDSILKSRDITLPTKVCLVKAMVFPVAMYGCESWTIKKLERRRTDAFKSRCWRRFSTFGLQEIKPVNPKGNQLWIFIGRTDAEASMGTANSLEKTLMLGKTEGKRRRGCQRMRWLDVITDSCNGHEFEQTPGDSEGQGSLACCIPWDC